MRHPSGIPHSNGSSMHNANQAGRLLATLTDAPPAKSQKKHRVQASIQAHASALSPPRSLFLGDPLGDSSVHSRASERDVDVSNHSQVSELSSLSEGGPLTSAELGPQSEPVRIPSRRSIHASVAAHVRAAAAAVAVKAEQDPVVRQVPTMHSLCTMKLPSMYLGCRSFRPTRPALQPFTSFLSMSIYSLSHACTRPPTVFQMWHLSACAH